MLIQLQKHLLLWQYFTKGDKNFSESEKSTGQQLLLCGIHCFCHFSNNLRNTASLTIDTLSTFGFNNRYSLTHLN
jgi:hypothetical protein